MYTKSNDRIFADGFESGTFAPPWTSAVNAGSRINITAAAATSGSTKGMAALISGGTSGYVVDGLPANEPSYHARFYFNPNGVALGNANHNLLVGLNASNQIAFRVQLRRSGGLNPQYQIRASVSRAGGSTSTNWFSITNAYHPIEIAWQSAGSALVSLYVDGALKQTLTNLNTSAYLIDSVRLGPPSSGISSSVSGTEYFDDFYSSRTILIGP